VKKILNFIIIFFFWSTALYAKNITYICEVTDSKNKTFKEIFEIKNDQFLSDGYILKTSSIKINNISAEVNYYWNKSNVRHKVNFKNGKGFEIWTSETTTSTYYLNCSVI
tara:strand:- start:92 stop:421 length:330 start_codon:yes stop_codon:yes gene_type:complete